MKRILMFLATIALILTTYLTYTSFVNEKSSTEIKAPLKQDEDTYITQPNVDKFSTSTKWLDVSIDYPEGVKIVKDEIFKDYYSWASDTQILSVTSEAKAKEFMIQDGMQYEYTAEYTIASSSDSVSYLYDIYNFTGGAHGGSVKRVFSFDLNGNKKEIKISDASITKVLPLIRTDIKKQIMEGAQLKESEVDTKWINDGTAVKKENYSTYWYDGDNVVFYFGQYQVGPYVMGDFEVKIPRKSL